MCKEIMHDDSVLFIQTSQADMVKNNEFDTIYHEHLSFFNANSMNALSERAGLHLVNVEKTPIHGNSYVFVFKKNPSQGNIKQVLAEERTQGAQDLETYKIYEQRCLDVLVTLDERLKIFKLDQYTIVGYGAAAKGMTLINAGNLHLDWIIDDNPLKQGKFAPGSNIPIVSIEKLKELTTNKIVFVPLAWNFFKEIKSKIKAQRNNNKDIFLKYFPKVEEE